MTSIFSLNKTDNLKTAFTEFNYKVFKNKIKNNNVELIFKTY